MPPARHDETPKRQHAWSLEPMGIWLAQAPQADRQRRKDLERSDRADTPAAMAGRTSAITKPDRPWSVGTAYRTRRPFSGWKESQTLRPARFKDPQEEPRLAVDRDSRLDYQARAGLIASFVIYGVEPS
jgi:hypothetical protein